MSTIHKYQPIESQETKADDTSVASIEETPKNEEPRVEIVPPTSVVDKPVVDDTTQNDGLAPQPSDVSTEPITPATDEPQTIAEDGTISADSASEEPPVSPESNSPQEEKKPLVDSSELPTIPHFDDHADKPSAPTTPEPSTT